MSVTVDTNVLLYASNRDAPEHETAVELIGRLAAGPGLVVLLWPVIMAYLRIATHPAVFANPLDPDTATANIDTLLRPAHVHTAGPGPRHWEHYRRVTGDVPTRANHVPDAQIAALMIEHGIDTIWTRDRDFRRYDGITPRDPFTASA